MVAVAVTGSAGNLGRHVVRELHEHGYGKQHPRDHFGQDHHRDLCQVFGQHRPPLKRGRVSTGRSVGALTTMVSGSSG